MNKNPKLIKLKEARMNANFTIKELSNMLGISSSMYGYIESGEKRLSYDIAVKLADIFKTTPDKLFYEDFENFFKDIDI